MTFEKKLGLSNAKHERMYKLIMDLIPSDWKYFETFRKRLLKTFFYNNKGTKKVKDFRKYSNKKNLTKYFSILYFMGKTKWIEENHILSPDIWRKCFTDWFIKYSSGYTCSIWYKFIYFAPFKPCNI